jgi:hypothetical protein
VKQPKTGSLLPKAGQLAGLTLLSDLQSILVKTLHRTEKFNKIIRTHHLDIAVISLMGFYSQQYNFLSHQSHETAYSYSKSNGKLWLISFFPIATGSVVFQQLGHCITDQIKCTLARYSKPDVASQLVEASACRKRHNANNA